MGNENLTQDVRRQLDSLELKGYTTSQKAKGWFLDSLSLPDKESKKAITFITSSWEAVEIVSLIELYKEYILGNYEWKHVCSFDMSASLSKIQLANVQGSLDEQARTYVKNNVTDSNDVHAKKSKIDLISELIAFDFDLEKIKSKYIMDLAVSVEFLKQYIAIDLEKSLSAKQNKKHLKRNPITENGLNRVNDEFVITESSLHKIGTYMVRLLNLTRELEKAEKIFKVNNHENLYSHYHYDAKMIYDYLNELKRASEEKPKEEKAKIVIGV